MTSQPTATAAMFQAIRTYERHVCHIRQAITIKMQTTIPLVYRGKWKYQDFTALMPTLLADDDRVSEPRPGTFEWHAASDRHVVARVAVTDMELRIATTADLLALFQTQLPPAFRNYCSIHLGNKHTTLHIGQAEAVWMFVPGDRGCYRLERRAALDNPDVAPTDALSELIFRRTADTADNLYVSASDNMFHTPLFRPRPVLFERDGFQVIPANGTLNALTVYERHGAIPTTLDTFKPFRHPFPWAVICPPGRVDDISVYQVLAAGIHDGALRAAFDTCVSTDATRCLYPYLDPQLQRNYTPVSSFKMELIVDALRNAGESWGPPILVPNNTDAEHTIAIHLCELSDAVGALVPQCPELPYYRVRDGILPATLQFAIQFDDRVILLGDVPNVDILRAAVRWVERSVM